MGFGDADGEEFPGRAAIHGNRTHRPRVAAPRQSDHAALLDLLGNSGFQPKKTGDGHGGTIAFNSRRRIQLRVCPISESHASDIVA